MGDQKNPEGGSEQTKEQLGEDVDGGMSEETFHILTGPLEEVDGAGIGTSPGSGFPLEDVEGGGIHLPPAGTGGDPND